MVGVATETPPHFRISDGLLCVTQEKIARMKTYQPAFFLLCAKSSQHIWRVGSLAIRRDVGNGVGEGTTRHSRGTAELALA